MKKSFLLIPSLGMLALMGFGCNPLADLRAKVEQKVTQGVAERVIKNRTGADVDFQDGKVSYTDPKTGDTSTWGQDVSIPDNFPNDLPIYAGSKAITVSVTDGGKGASALFTTSDAPAKVAEWYKGQLTGAGFTADSTMAMGDGQIATYKKGAVTISVIVTQQENDGQPTTSIALGRQEQAQ